MDSKELLECISFFNEVNVSVLNAGSHNSEDNKGLKLVVKVEYTFRGKRFATKPLYYQEVSYLDSVQDISGLHNYFGPQVYWLDIVQHKWPQGSGESDLDNLVVNDIAEEGDLDFKQFLLSLANNSQNGFIQKITKDGRPGQYYHNLENNNHWHDLVMMIKAAISGKGNPIDRQFFAPLVFKWYNGKRTSLCLRNPYKIVSDLYFNLKSIQPAMKLTELTALLNYKKQIILQGPPGTGKTRLAKEIASLLITKGEITEEDILDSVKIGDTINSSTGYTTYVVDSFSKTAVNLKLDNGNTQSPTLQKIIQAFKDQKWDGGTTGGDAYETAIAKHIYQNYLPESQYKIIQFHPSYSYEDFVRGIVAESKGEKIEYRNVNKIFGDFASAALENARLSKVDNLIAQQQKWSNEKFEEFKVEIETQVEQGQVILSGEIGVFGLESDCFRYGKNWGVPSRINFIDFKNLIKAVLSGRLDLNQNQIDKEISIHAHYRFTYYLALLRLFFRNNKFQVSNVKIEPKNYVIIIDEINRANLSSVLGELIYALEYRGESVNSMYAIDGDSKIILSPNLYIIGTMNTADRSVGHIDYAIRRRFSFVDILPIELQENEKIYFYSDGFKKVGALFNQVNVSSEFKVKDVQIGHSYFIVKKVDAANETRRDEIFKMKMNYEVVPILLEYVKDGVLKGEIEGKKVEDYIDNDIRIK